ncbi:cyclopropane-fatty-acyl-phospholipid synthase [Mycobacterium antarcticum]|uniref:cyclopropane mycolic acid synthase family methyltransferase n=1 Tax=unclassified Mycolicibacterium TaxID=2636767 RepID=UPI00238430CB|nr:MULTISPECIES: cyclopropane mycolic acid synthase family methyltransferase [unclassified Mycolicibacterium]BDX32181.1 cyclopropane-fatty-acyl-phospholipid synthase [Mycolicibacterium sp. TUM20985]GLP75488.1 cyclopropane-fatty-acyl-phospholipid synthase [Mycolicibacterium sp. TUM20983]GLP84251.1 cyclopropane-fatty-acyl-phospholipid synthase [Mycolicibacterium sp. TUM20984]
MSANQQKQDLKPHFDDIQAHYDLSDDFFRLFLDETQTYSCAYFERHDMSLHEAQLAKIDLSLGKLNLEPGMTLLDIGCGWGATMKRAVEKYDVNVVGLTLSRNQAAHVEKLLADLPTERSRRVELMGWEEFDGHVDRIVSIGAFEHFGYDRYGRFFEMAHQALPDDGIMLLHTITRAGPEEREELNLPVTMSLLRFTKFISDEIFPGGQIPVIAEVEKFCAEMDFTIDRIHKLGPHYAKTLDIWSAALEARRDEAIALQSDEVYERYMKYLTGCADLFHRGYTNLCQFTLSK